MKRRHADDTRAALEQRGQVANLLLIDTGLRGEVEVLDLPGVGRDRRGDWRGRIVALVSVGS